VAKESSDEAARRAVIREWDSWTKENPEAAKGDPTAFFYYLRANRSDLLDLKSRGADKWQRVHGWLKRAGRVKSYRRG
jgi:hypothetical protein